MNHGSLVVRAVRARQGEHEVFAFFASGSRLLELAEIPVLAPAENGSLIGYQRPKIRQQVRAIAEYLALGDVLFPNAIVLAVSSDVRFVAARGTKPNALDPQSDAGTLTIPFNPHRATAWVVDGQQRTLALAEAGAKNLNVPVIAFVSDDIGVQREQFILVNKARPLPARLIDELLPEVASQLPRDLSARKIPSVLCNALNDLRESPFHQIVKRPSTTGRSAFILDSSLTKIIRRSIQDPRGALAAFVSSDGSTDASAMLKVMIDFWSAVRDVFRHAWGLTPDKSRLMHSAGISAMGVLMDQVMTQTNGVSPYEHACKTLGRMEPYCHWTSGRWETLDRNWNDIQNTPRDVRLLSNYLITLERQVRTE